MSSSFVVVLTTLPNLVQSRRLARLVLQKRLAACVNVLGPASSFFWWEGKIDQAREYLLLIKTRGSQFPHLRSLIGKHHPYSVPEIIALPIRKGNASYLKWIQTSLREARRRRTKKPSLI